MRRSRLAWRPNSLGAIAGLALVAVVFNLGTRSPQKAAAAERVIGRVSLAEDITDRRQLQFDAATSFLDAYRLQLLPGLGNSVALRTQLDAAFPTAARLRSPEGNAALRNVEGNIGFRRRNIVAFGDIDALPISGLVWAATRATRAGRRDRDRDRDRSRIAWRGAQNSA